jgi:hypothetical protein
MLSLVWRRLQVDEPRRVQAGYKTIQGHVEAHPGSSNHTPLDDSTKVNRYAYLLGADDEGPSEMPVPVTWAGRVMFACLLYLNRCGDGGKG